MSVFVLDKRGRPLMPCSEKRARLLLERGRARVHRILPFVIRLTDRLTSNSEFQPLVVKIEPGSKVTGLALVREGGVGTAVLNLFELMHRGRQISETLATRRNFRRRRRSANLRYRAPRFHNVIRQDGWLPPSVKHRVDSTMSWVIRLIRWTPISRLATELVRFDSEALQKAEITGSRHQQDQLITHELREYLLEKWQRQCGYCGAEGLPLQIRHIVSQARGGLDVSSNLTLSCSTCAAAQDMHELDAGEATHARMARTVRDPQADVAAVAGSRGALAARLKDTGISVELSSGGRTKWNRARLELPKSQALAAVCVGTIGSVSGWQRPTLQIKCKGRGSYQRTRVTAQGFPRGYLMPGKRVRGFQTGDRVQANVPAGKKAGNHVGRVAVRASGSFNVQTPQGVVQGVSYRHCVILQRADGYDYSVA